MTGADVKGYAIGAAVLVGVAGAVWLFFRGREAVAAVAEKAGEVGDFIFSAGEAPETLGTTIHEFFNKPPEDRNPDGKPYWWDYSQAEKTLIALISQREKTGFE